MSKLYEVMDLGFGKCKMCICGPNEAREYLKSKGIEFKEKVSRCIVCLNIFCPWIRAQQAPER